MGCLCLRRQKEVPKEASKMPEIEEENNPTSRMFLSRDVGYHTIDQSSQKIPNLNSLPQKRERLTDSPRAEIESKPRKSVPGISNSYTPSNRSQPRYSVPAKIKKSASSSENSTPRKSLPTHIKESSSRLDLKPKSPHTGPKRQQELYQSSQTSNKGPIEKSDSVSSTDSNPFANSVLISSQSSVEPRLSQNSYPLLNSPSYLSPQNSLTPTEISEKQDLDDKTQYEPIINARINTISQRLPINSLKAVYFFNKEFKQRVDKIKPLYQSWARVRGDGNCYYRAIGVAFMELCCRPTTSPELIIRYANALKLVVDYAVSGTPFETYSYHFSELNTLCMKKQNNSPDIMVHLSNLLQDPQFDQGMVSEMRKLAAYVLDVNRRNPDFTAFMIDSFGSHMNAILTWGQEAEGIEFKCMSEALGVHIQHVSVYDSDSINTFSPSISTEDKIHILYKTGHYDLLYPAEHNMLDGYDIDSGRFIIKEY